MLRVNHKYYKLCINCSICAQLHAVDYIPGHRFTNCEWDYISALSWRKKQKMCMSKIQSRYLLIKKQAHITWNIILMNYPHVQKEKQDWIKKKQKKDNNTEFFVFNLDHSSPLTNSDIIVTAAVRMWLYLNTNWMWDHLFQDSCRKMLKKLVNLHISGHIHCCKHSIDL
jgi:hypothetical protein